MYKCSLSARDVIVTAVVMVILHDIWGIEIVHPETFAQMDLGRAEDAAYQHLYQVMDRYSGTFDVYTDADAGGNHFIPNGWMGDVHDIVTFDEAYATNPHSGLTCIKVTYSAAGSGGQSWAGVYWLPDTSRWFAERGYDLTGAAKLSFWARGAIGGERIEFLVGGFNRGSDRDPDLPSSDSFGPKSTSVIRLERTWQKYEIDLAEEDLSNVIGGFCWSTNFRRNRQGCTFYLDDIRYHLDRHRHLRLLQSYELVSACDDRSLSNVAFTYDNALALLALLARRNPADLERSKILANALVYAQKHDRHFRGDDFDGRLRNAYRSGEIADSVHTFAQLPGWSEPPCYPWREDAVQVGTSTGDVAWALIALLEAFKVLNDTGYFEAAVNLGDWIETQCRDSSGPRGYAGGYEGWATDTASETHGQFKRRWKSTEHNIDIYVAFRRLYGITKMPQWEKGAQHARQFVESMWNDSLGCFWTGTEVNGKTPSAHTFPLDVNTWALLAFGNHGKYARSIEWIENNCLVRGCSTGCDIAGFDYNNDGDGVWLEGTAQMCLAYEVVGRHERAKAYLHELAKAQKKCVHGNELGLVAACHDSVSTGFGWEYHSRLHVGTTAWYIFALKHHNPYWSNVIQQSN